MAINGYTVRKHAALLFPPVFVASAVMGIMLLTKNLWFGIGGGIATLLVFYVVALFMLSHPFRKAMEGSGILVLDVCSTGIIGMYSCRIVSAQNTKYVMGKIAGKAVNHIFDRNAMYFVNPPADKDTAGNPLRVVMTKEGGIQTLNDAEAMNMTRFVMGGIPCLLYNSAIGAFLTKDHFAEYEKGAFAEHQILLLNRRIEVLTQALLNYGRYVVNMAFKKTNILGSWWFWIIVVILIIGAGIFVVPKLIPIVQNMMGGAAEKVSQVIPSAQPNIVPTTMPG